MGKEKIKIRYIIFVLITMGVIFFGKITRLDNLNAEKIAGIILVSPPYKKRITGQQKIEEFTILFNDRKKKPVFSITPPCIFRKNCASVPEERSAIPLQTEQSSAG